MSSACRAQMLLGLDCICVEELSIDEFFEPLAPSSLLISVDFSC